MIFVTGCYYSTISLGATGVTVTVKTYPGGAVVDSGPTDATGMFNFTLPVSGVRYTVIVSGPRWNTSTTTPILTTGIQQNANIGATSSYTCTYICGTPLAHTMHGTFANAGAQTFTYASAKWTASFTYLAIAYVVNLWYDGTMTATKAGVAFTPAFGLTSCPYTPGFSGIITSNDPGSVLGNAVITE